jgi:hypothetical protein
VQVVLVPDRPARLRDVLLLIRPEDIEVSGSRQVQAAPAGTLREVIDDLIRPAPAHGRARRPRLLPQLRDQRLQHRDPLILRF